MSDVIGSQHPKAAQILHQQIGDQPAQRAISRSTQARYRTPGDTVPPWQPQLSPTRQKLGRGYELGIKHYPNLAAQEIEQNCHALIVGYSIE